MELEFLEGKLKKISLKHLEPSLQREIIEFATEMNHETTITSSSNLNFLFKIYQAEKAKKKGSLKVLKKAEDIILRLNTLQYSKTRDDSARARTDRGKLDAARSGIRPRVLSDGLVVNKKTVDLFRSIGVEDEAVMQKTVELFGEPKVEERIEIIHASNLGEDLIKKLFPKHPEIIQTPRDDDFFSDIEAIENKKDIIDTYTEGADQTSLDYYANPSILLKSFKDIMSILKPDEHEEAKDEIETTQEVKYRGKPMHPDDFKKVLLSMGFEVVRRAKHNTLLRRGGDQIIGVQPAHNKQEMLNGPTIKTKLNEARVNLSEFERARRDLGL